MASNEIDTLRFQAHNEIELFVKSIVRKYKSLFRNRTFGYHIPASEIPEIDFPYEVHFKITIKK